VRNVDDVTISSYYRNLMTREKKLTDTQQKISSGKNFNRASESPSDAIDLMRINASKQCMARQSKRLEKNQEVVEQISSVYSNIDNFMLEIDQLCMDAVDGIKSHDMKMNLVNQIDSLVEEIADEASRYYMGHPLLGDFERSDGKFGDFSKIAVTDSKILYVSNQRQMDIMPNNHIDDMLNSINEFCRSIENEQDDVARENWGEIRQEWGKLQDQNGILGSKSLFMQSLLERNEDIDLNYETVRSRIEDLDIAKASIDLFNAENSFNLALEVANRMQEILDPNKFL